MVFTAVSLMKGILFKTHKVSRLHYLYMNKTGESRKPSRVHMMRDTLGS